MRGRHLAALSRHRVKMVARTGAVETRSDGSVVISPEQRAKHVFWEGVAVFAAAPFSFWLASQKALPMWARVACGTMGAVTVYVDGTLLYSFLTEKGK